MGADAILLISLAYPSSVTATAFTVYAKGPDWCSTAWGYSALSLTLTPTLTPTLTKTLTKTPNPKPTPTPTPTPNQTVLCLRELPSISQRCAAISDERLFKACNAPQHGQSALASPCQPVRLLGCPPTSLLQRRTRLLGATPLG